MKKYLMTGIAVLALCAGFTSCSHDSEGFTSLQDVSTSKYETSFVKRYGEIDKNQNWGFGTTRTRAEINVNGNQWATCPELGPTEDADVTGYVAALTTYPKIAPTGLTNYYVTQVHCGTDTYTDLDNHSGILGSSKMNHLMIAQSSTASFDVISGTAGTLSGDWEHINNFNRGNDTDWKGNTLVTSGGTYDFAYLGSEDSKYHNRWIAVDGADIDRKLGVNKYSGYYYICFDFEAVNDNVVTKMEVKWTDGGGNHTENIDINGAYTVESATAANLKITVGGKEITVGQTGYEYRVFQYVNGNQVVIGNNVYTDWIVRLVKANPAIPYAGRIICEDLGGSDDFDFNDVVFSAYIDAANNKTYIKLEAAGGTLPLTVAGVEVHDKFAEENPNAGITRSTMINTGKGPQVAPVEFVVNQAYTNYNAIPVVVTMDASLYGGGTGQELIELKAEMGKAPQKIMVTSDYVICTERQQIENKYNLFPNWVKDASVKWY
ncbi:MAG: hypothetical protein IJ082_06495 [Prevotella sp.]|nr:hypothetical protein [Prevotella sp.]